MSVNPRIYLAIDNCFAQKRFTRPQEWCEVIRSLGLQYIEASADTELDPLYMDRAYLRDWICEVQRAQERNGVKVVNLYSGHGSYTTLGLMHSDERVRLHLIREWFYPMIDIAAQLDAGFGFYAHAFPHSTLQDAAAYAAQVERLTETLAMLNRHAADRGCRALSVEQMYAPHQYPWRIRDAEQLIREVTRRSGRSFYFTEDLGHHSTQFLLPSAARVSSMLGGIEDGCWLGSDAAYAVADENPRELEAALFQVMRDIDTHRHLFAKPEDGDCYAWLERLGCYSPIIHLQQTDGNHSGHFSFTPEMNAWGKVRPEAVLQKLWRSCQSPVRAGMPEPCEKIFLTFEIFIGAAAPIHDALEQIRTSVRYWRKWIPEDGLPLSALI